MFNVKSYALESVDENDEELIAAGDAAEAELVSMEALTNFTKTISVEEFQLGMEERGFLRRIGGNIADSTKLLFAWADGNGAKIRRNRALIRSARNALKASEGTQMVRGSGLVTYLGDLAHHANDVKSLVALVTKDVEHTNKILVPMIKAAGGFSKELVEWIYSKDNDWKWGYDEAVEGTLPIINAYMRDLTACGVGYKVQGYDHNDLRVEDGSKFSVLFLGNYAISTNWADTHEQAKHLQPSEALETYATDAAHDFVKVPKQGNKYGLSGSIGRKELETLLDAADQYLDAADEAAKSIKANAGPIFKMSAMSNIFSGSLGVLGKTMSSKNYRALYATMVSSTQWAMKLQRKSATRNQDIAKHLAEFVQSNLR